MSDAALVQLSRAQTALAECKTAMEAKQIADMAEAARVYLERTNASVATVNNATEIRLLAERQMGEFLKAMPKATGARMAGGDEVGKPVVTDGNRRSVETLADIGITKKQSHVAQKLAAIPEPEFRERIAIAKCDGGKLSTAKVLPAKPAPREIVVPFVVPPQRSQQQAKARESTQYVPPARGLMMARGAISHLEEIPTKDAERDAGIRLVLDWCISHVSKT